MLRILLLAGCLLPTIHAIAESLPQPLSLEQALAFVDENHPVVQVVNAREANAAANLLAEESDDDLSVVLEGRLQYLEPAELSNFQENNDSRIELVVDKRLYDFGYTDARQEAARANVESAQWAGVSTRQRQQIRVLRAFLGVLLADLEYARDNEAVAIAYVRLDRFRNRHQLGQLSDVELLQKENLYEKVLSLRAKSQAKQNSTRLRLALALNRPAEIPNDLIPPASPDMASGLPELQLLVQQVLGNNASLKSLDSKIVAAEQSLNAARKRYGPVLRGELGVHQYYRETRSTSPFNAALVLEMPLYSGGRSDAEAARARGELMGARALRNQLELELRQQVLELWLDQNTLQQKMKELLVREEYRDLYLDRSRTLYELERTSDLGDAMVQISAVKLAVAKVQYQWMINQMRIRALTGELQVTTGKEG
jgi:outer membrane protein TolC